MKISTGKLHARGPVGFDGLVTYKYILSGSGQCVSRYIGQNARRFTHHSHTLDYVGLAARIWSLRRNPSVLRQPTNK